MLQSDKIFFSTNKQWQTGCHCLLQTVVVTNCISNSTEGQLTPPFSIFSLFFFCFSLQGTDLLFSKTVFSLGKAGSGTVLSLRVWKWRWQDVDEEAWSITSNRPCPGVLTLPTSNEPERLCFTQLSPSHSLPTAFLPHRHTKIDKYTYTGCSEFSINHQVCCLLADKNKTFYILPDSGITVF